MHIWQEKHTVVLRVQKWLIFVLSLIIVSCNRMNDNHTETSPIIITADKNYTTIDSLLGRIANDTIALLNYLSLAQAGQEHYAVLKIYRQLGLHYLGCYDFFNAIKYHTLYLEMAEKIGDPAGEVEALNTLAHDYMEVCALDESSQYYFSALSLSRKLSETDKEKGESGEAEALNGLGNIYLRINQPDEALPYFRQSLQIENSYNHTLGIAKNLADIGTYFKSKAAYDSAHYYLDRSLQLYIKSNWVSGINLCYGRIGNIYMMEGDFHSASVYIDSAYKSLLHTSDKLNWLNACYALGNIHIQKREYAEAETLLLEGMQVSGELKLPSWLEKGSILLSELYRQQGNHAAALDAYTMSISYGKAFRSERNISRIMTHRLAYEKKLNETEKILLATQLKNIEEKKTKAIYAILLFFTALSGFIISGIQQHKLKEHKVELSLYQEKMKSDLYLNISHEFKTPATIITGLVERIRNNLDSPNLLKSATDLDILSRQSQHLLSLIDGMSSTIIVRGNITSYLSCLFESFSLFAKDKKVDYSFFDNATELYMDYQPEKIRLIFSKLLSHIIQQSRQYESVSATIAHNKEKKCCLVSISKSHSKPYFPHFRNPMNSIPKNLLSYVTQQVQALNGTLEIERRKSEKETVFKIYLPTLHTEANTGGQSISMQDSPVTSTNFHNTNETAFLPEKENPTVLIMENNRDMAYWLSSILQKNYQVILSNEIRKAHRKVEEEMPDVIISDISTLGMNGFDLCREIKSTDTTAHIPIILLSVHNSREERIKGFNCKADAFLAKPLHEEELLATISQLLDVRKQIRSKYALATIHTGREKEDSTIKKEASMAFVKQITDLIYKEISNTENIIEIIAGKTCLSTSQLNRKIKAATGMTTSNYILKVRLNKAAQLLSRSQKPIGEIAMNCGFNDFAYFSRTFKKEFNMTPTSFQRLPHSIN